MIDVSKLKNLFIYHPGGTGGNHLANLISLIPIFESRLENYEGDYQQFFNKEYDRFTNPKFLPILPSQIHNMKSHFLIKHGLDGLDDTEFRKHLLSNKRINILTGHWHCFYSRNLSDFTNNAWIRMSFPKEGSLAFKRIKMFNFLPQQVEVYIESYEILDKYPGFKNSAYLDTDMFFQDNGSEYLREFLKHNFEIELPAIADEMHSKWIYGIKTSLKLFTDT